MIAKHRHSGAGGVFLFVTLVATVGIGALAARAQDAPVKESKRASLSLKATPSISFSPARISLVAELKGGANDAEEYYCTAIEWDWGDGTKSESNSDCEPYEAGKSEIRRRFTTTHVYPAAGNYRVQISLRKRTKLVIAASTTVQVRPGLRDLSNIS